MWRRIKRAADLASAEPIDNRTPDLEVLRSERRIEIMSVLQRLSQLDRVVIEARYYDGMTYRELADAVGMSHGGVRQRVASAVRRLGMLMWRGRVLDPDSVLRLP